MTVLIGALLCLVLAGLLPVLMMALSLRRLLQPRGLVFDEQGILYWQGDWQQLLPWPELAAVGIGYEQTFQPRAWLGWFARPWGSR